MTIAPVAIVVLLVAAFHTALYVAVRGNAGGRLPLTYGAAALGAWAGDALGQRLGVELLTLGDVRLVSASILAWVGIAFVAVVATLGPQSARS